MDKLQVLIENGPQIVEALVMIVGAAAILASLTPTLKDDNIIAKITRVIDVLGMNIGKAKNDPKDAE